MSRKPVIALVATGGTIAGRAASATNTTAYTAGVLTAADLLAAVPGLADIAELRAETPFSIDSKDMTPTHWLALAQRVQALVEQSDIDGVVITHGTDTLEETAFFLHLTLATDKPVVFTAAMRPASALSADGPMNLYGAVRVAASGAFRGLGTLVVMNDRVYGARHVTKQHTRAVDAFAAGDGEPLGWANPPTLTRRPAREEHGQIPLATIDAAHWPPKVEILYLAAGSSPALLDAVRKLGAAGAVLALPGNGSVPAAWEAAIGAALADGFPLLRASRVTRGAVWPDDSLPALPSAGELPPLKARIALMLDCAIRAANTQPASENLTHILYGASSR